MNDQKPNIEVLQREVERILPELMQRIWGNGSFSMDTDTLSIPEDYHKLEWLSRIVAGFVFDERQLWKPGYDEAVRKYQTQSERMRTLDHILGKARETSQKENVTVDELKEIISRYRDPMEDYYDQRDRAKKLMAIFSVSSEEKVEENTEEA